MWFWFSKTLVEVGIGLALVLLFTLPLIFMILKNWVKQQFCKHTEYFENRACHGICRECRKDLGFIQPLREDRTKKEV